MFRINNRYRLDLRWGNVRYVREDGVSLDSCFFSGPVLKDMVEIKGSDKIRLDFSHQYSHFVNSYYIAVLSWGGVHVTRDAIRLGDAFLSNKDVTTVPEFNRGDYIIIDTSDHEEEEHHKSLNYKAYIVNQDGEFYDFRR